MKFLNLPKFHPWEWIERNRMFESPQPSVIDVLSKGLRHGSCGAKDLPFESAPLEQRVNLQQILHSRLPAHHHHSGTRI
jgi:hypothetical protein